MPFRPIVDYYTKSITSAIQVYSRNTWTSKWIGLLIDSAGTNSGAWNYLMFLLRNHFEREKNPDDAWQAIIESDDIICSPEFVARARKMGVTPKDYFCCKNPREMMREFAPQEFKRFLH